MRRIIITAAIIVLIALILALLFIFLLPASTSAAFSVRVSSKMSNLTDIFAA